MDKRVPVWLVLLLLLLSTVATVLFGWSVRYQLSGGERLGRAGEIALAIATFPSLVKDVFEEGASIVTGQIYDNTFGAPRMPVDLIDYAKFPSRTDPLPGLVYKATDAITLGWRVLFGSFATGNSIENAVVVISPELEIATIIPVDEIPVGDKTPSPNSNKFAHGLEIFPDGSFIFAFDGGVSLQKFDACGERIWTIPGVYHHSVTTLEDQSAVWTFNDSLDFALVSVVDGTVLRTFSTDDVIAANPTIDILELRRLHDNDLGKNPKNTKGSWMSDALHYNDVDPLPPALANRFDQFDAGDLLVSARAGNLIFVVDPDDLIVKWWRVGAVQRQHDPDWMPDGRISIYNNRMSRDYSEIVSVDPDTFQTKVTLDGRDYDFYSRIRGKHQWIDSGNLLFSSPQQGRLLEIDANGAVALEIFNLNPDIDNRNLTVSEIKWFEPDYFNADIWECND